MAKVRVFQPHDAEEAFPSYHTFKVFLAGTIDKGNSVDWQSQFIDWIKESEKDEDDKFTYVVYNPRRKEDFGEDTKEYDYQANWELDHLERCDKIIMNILGTSKSPISLMELGTFKNRNIDVICEPNFYRYQYVKIFCSRYDIPLYNSMEEYKKVMSQQSISNED